LDSRADIFSLGVVLYEMITNRTPFDGPTPSDIIALILQKDAPPLARFARNVPSELERIVMKALRKNREARYQTVKDLALDRKDSTQRVAPAGLGSRALAGEVSSSSCRGTGIPAPILWRRAETGGAGREGLGAGREGAGAGQGTVAAAIPSGEQPPDVRD